MLRKGTSRRVAGGWLLALLWAPAVIAAAGGESPALPVDRWLRLGPTPAALPAFHDEAAGGCDLGDLLESTSLPGQDLRPAAGEPVAWSSGATLLWEEAPADGGLAPGGADGVRDAYLATYLAVSRFTSAKLVVRGHHPIRVAVDGEQVAKQSGCVPAADDGQEGKEGGKKKAKKKAGGDDAPMSGEVEASLDLDPGVHRVLVRTLRDPDCAHPWTVEATLEPTGEEAPAASFTTSPEHPLELAQVLDAPHPSRVRLSPDGDLVAVTLARIRPGTDEGESWVEVRRTADGTLERTYRGGSRSSVDWSPVGRRLSYVTREDKKATLWVDDLDTGEVRPVLEAIENMGSYRWAPDGRSVIYAISVKPPEDEHGFQRLLGLQDRQAGWRERSYLYQVSVPGGASRRLTAGELTTELTDISPDGKRLLFTRTVDDYDQRPFLRSELHVLDLETLESRLLHPGPWLDAASWSPDGSRVLVVAGPSAFDGAGATVAQETTPNDYDGQLYLLDLADGAATPLSREFDPAIGRASWHRGDGQIYLTATDGSRVRLFGLDPQARRYTALQTGVDVVSSWDLSPEAPAAVVAGSGAAQAPRVVALDLRAGKAREILVPGADAFRHVRLGKVEPWSFTSRRGAVIEGRVHYPPDFDPSRRYPAIVYYYGGTSPTTRDFGGRYPKNLWAAHGYVVYVLQPSGAIGYGQEFSALHVNDWGEIAGDDILEGVDKFLAAHPFVDPERLGCIGASYGGFMTQYLLTRTERFAAGISHAGISFLGSYWGEGYWGYAYSGVATADSYPWTRGDLYVGRSPLFHAEKIRTPLLLLHGTADTNVPPGESEQLYTALKLLKRPVEYVRIEGQNHHILKHDQRVLWSRTIVAWFDRWLKDQPEWWEHLYPEPGAAGDD